MGKNLKGKEIGAGIYQRKDGRYYARYYGRDGKLIGQYFHSLTDAKRWLIDSKYEESHCKIANPRKIIVDSWFWYWIDEIKGDSIRHGTKRAYVDRYNNRIKPVIGDMLLADIKPLHCQNVLNLAQDAGDTSGSVRKLRVIMHSFFEAAYDNDMIPANPIRSSVTYVNTSSDERRVLTLDEQDLFLKTAKNYPYYHMFAFALQTGMRVGEISGLKWEDINMSTGYLKVQRSLDYRDDLKMFFENPPKSKSGEREIPLTDEAVEILMTVKRNSADLPAVAPYTHLVFRNTAGKPSHRGNLNRTLRRIADEAGMESLSMHVLRHTFATRCIEAGMRPKTLQKILGHSNITLTMNLYVHVTHDSLKEEMKKFGALTKMA